VVSIGWVRFDSFPDQELIAENNLTMCVKFGIILIESERATLDLSLWMNIDDSSQLRQ